MTTFLFLLLLVLMLAVGIFSGRSSDEEGFQIYNRSLPRAGFVVSYVATFVGAGFFVMGTAYAYRFGHGMLWYAAGLVLGIVIFASFSRWLKEWQQDSNCYNLPDFFRIRFGSLSGKASAALTVTLLVGDLAIQLISGGKILEILGISSYPTAICITVTVISVYLLAGGFRAVVWTDFVLATLICGVTVFISIISFKSHQSVDLSFDRMPVSNIIGFFLFGIFGPFSISTYYQRVFASKDRETAISGTLISGAILFFLLILIVRVGFGAKASLPGIDPDIAFVSLLEHSGGWFFTGGALALWAALMSTADTLSFAAGQILVQNIFGRKLTRRSTQISIIIIMLLGALTSFALPSIVSVGMLFLGGGMILAPIGFFQWILNIQEFDVSAAILAGLCSIIIFLAISPISPTIVVVTFGATTITLLSSYCLSRLKHRTGTRRN